MSTDAAASPSRGLRIFIVSYLYEPNIQQGMGGFQKVFELGRQLARFHQVTFFLPAYSRHSTDLDCVWVPVVNLPMLRMLSFNLATAIAILVRALRGRPHIVYQRIFNAFGPAVAATLLGSRLVVEFNGNPLDFYRAHSSAGRPWVRRLIGWNLQQADRVVALTEGLRSEILSDFGVDNSHVFVAPSGSNPDVFYPRDRQECRQALGIKRDALVAVFAGTFFPYQGIDDLLAALADPRLRHLDVWLLGEGVMRSAWESRAAQLGLERVRFAGQVEWARVPVFIGAADFCLAPFDPSRGEVSPLKVLDYLFCARPTVISDIAPVQNLLDQFRSLLPFKAGDSGALAEALETMISAREDYGRRAERDSQLARQRYSWEQIAHDIEVNCFR